MSVENKHASHEPDYREQFRALRDACNTNGNTGDFQNIDEADLLPSDYEKLGELSRITDDLRDSGSEDELDAKFAIIASPLIEYKKDLALRLENGGAENVKQLQSRYHFAKVLINELQAIYSRQADKIMGSQP